MDGFQKLLHLQRLIGKLFSGCGYRVNGVASELLFFKSSVVALYKKSIEILEGYIVLAQKGDELPKIHVQLVGCVIPSFVLHAYNERAGV